MKNLNRFKTRVKLWENIPKWKLLKSIMKSWATPKIYRCTINILTRRSAKTRHQKVLIRRNHIILINNDLIRNKELLLKTVMLRKIYYFWARIQQGNKKESISKWKSRSHKLPVQVLVKSKSPGKIRKKLNELSKQNWYIFSFNPSFPVFLPYLDQFYPF